MQRLLKWTLIISISVLILLFLAGIIFSYYLEDYVKKEIRVKNADLSSLSVNFFTRSIQVNDLQWRSPNDSVPHVLQFNRVRIEGIGIFELLTARKIHVNRLLLKDGEITYSESIIPDSLKSAGSFPYSCLIENITLLNVTATVLNDSIKKLNGKIEKLDFSSVEINNVEDIQKTIQKSFTRLTGTFSKVFIELDEFYKLSISSLNFSSEAHSLTIDSLKVIPKFEKYAFARMAGKQKTRLELSIPLLQLEGLNYKSIFDSAFLVGKLSITSAHAVAFRDKRLPFIKKEIIPMPMEVLLKLPVSIEIDTIKLITSQVTIEEIEENSSHSGKVTFENLNAIMNNLGNSNYANKPSYAQLTASALLMGKGKINAAFRFPLDGSEVYSAKGKIHDFLLENLNPMLENSAHIRIESGILNELTFNFNYTDFNSVGSIEINYDNLKVTGLSITKENSINHFKTILINAALRNDKNEDVLRKKRMGAINFERDRKRFIFNYWWKSINDGLKNSVIHNENVMKSIDNKNNKK